MIPIIIKPIRPKTQKDIEFTIYRISVDELSKYKLFFQVKITVIITKIAVT